MIQARANQIRVYTYKGKQLTCQQLADIKGMPHPTMDARLRKYGLHTAMETPYKRQKGHGPKKTSWTYQGKEYFIDDAAAMLGMSIRGCRDRIKKLGFGEAMRLGPKDPRKKHEYRKAFLIIEEERLSAIAAQCVPEHITHLAFQAPWSTLMPQAASGQYLQY